MPPRREVRLFPVLLSLKKLSFRREWGLWDETPAPSPPRPTLRGGPLGPPTGKPASHLCWDCLPWHLGTAWRPCLFQAQQGAWDKVGAGSDAHKNPGLGSRPHQRATWPF